MASVLKLPDGGIKGLLVFTTFERDRYIRQSGHLQDLMMELKGKWLLGLHHNSAHADVHFEPDAVFDFHIAGPSDLFDSQGRPYYQIEMDCSNFCPDFFSDDRESRQKFWDILFVSRNVWFKSLDDLLSIARNLYDRRKFRILAIVTHENLHLKGFGPSRFMERYLEMFDEEERKFFTLLTPSLDAPFTFDLRTLAHFYHHSRSFLHVAKSERHPRVVAYAWASCLPVVAPLETGSLLPKRLKKPPGFFPYGTVDEAVDSLIKILDDGPGAADLAEYADHHLSSRNIRRFKDQVRKMYAHYGLEYVDSCWFLDSLDIRLARHHSGQHSPDAIPQSVLELILKLRSVDTDSLGKTEPEDFELYFSHLPTTFDQEIARKIDFDLRMRWRLEAMRRMATLWWRRFKRISVLIRRKT